MIVNFAKDLLILLGKRVKEPSSTNSLLSVLIFMGVSNPELLANGVTQIVAGGFAIWSFFKSDKSND